MLQSIVTVLSTECIPLSEIFINENFSFTHRFTSELQIYRLGQTVYFGLLTKGLLQVRHIKINYTVLLIFTHRPNFACKAMLVRALPKLSAFGEIKRRQKEK